MIKSNGIKGLPHEMQKCMGSLSVVEDNFGSGRLFIGPKTMVGERASEGGRERANPCPSCCRACLVPSFCTRSTSIFDLDKICSKVRGARREGRTERAFCNWIIAAHTHAHGKARIASEFRLRTFNFTQRKSESRSQQTPR